LHTGFDQVMEEAKVWEGGYTYLAFIGSLPCLSRFCSFWGGKAQKTKQTNKQTKKQTNKKTCEAWEHLCKEWGVAMYEIYALKMMMLLVTKLLNIYDVTFVVLTLLLSVHCHVFPCFVLVWGGRAPNKLKKQTDKQKTW